MPGKGLPVAAPGSRDLGVSPGKRFSSIRYFTLPSQELLPFVQSLAEQYSLQWEYSIRPTERQGTLLPEASRIDQGEDLPLLRVSALAQSIKDLASLDYNATELRQNGMILPVDPSERKSVSTFVSAVLDSSQMRCAKGVST